jgi:hypothetical protein
MKSAPPTSIRFAWIWRPTPALPRWKGRLSWTSRGWCHLTFVESQDLPGVIGYIGGVFGNNGVNIATFSLGRKDSGTEAISVIQTDQPVPDHVLAELLKNPAVKVARPVKFNGEP